MAAAVAVAVTFCVSGTPPAFAAPDSTPASRDQIEDRRQALLRLMLQDPSNLDVAFEYAALSVAGRRLRSGDLHARAHAHLRAQHSAPGA
jgi:hypothetical protein